MAGCSYWRLLIYEIHEKYPSSEERWNTLRKYILELWVYDFNSENETILMISHWGQEQIATIPQTPFPNAFS